MLREVAKIKQIKGKLFIDFACIIWIYNRVWKVEPFDQGDTIATTSIVKQFCVSEATILVLWSGNESVIGLDFSWFKWSLLQMSVGGGDNLPSVPPLPYSHTGLGPGLST